MSGQFVELESQLQTWAEGRGIRVGYAQFDPETPGEFDGLSVTMNRAYDLAERVFYFAHALGSIVRWSQSPDACRAVLDELHEAKRARDPGRLERAIDAYRRYEAETSDYAVTILSDLGFSEVLPAYTRVARADLDMMTHYHRTGAAPVWREFFPRWLAEVEAGGRKVEPFRPKPIGAFGPVRMPKQEIVQERDGRS